MITVDSHEPDIAKTIISQSVPCIVEDLNNHGWADYRLTDFRGAYVHVERKTWGELLSNISSVEYQLRRHLTNQTDSRLLFILEGISVPTPEGTSILRATNKNVVYVKGHTSSIRLSQIYSWLYQIGKFIEIYTTPNYEATCMALISFYK